MARGWSESGLRTGKAPSESAWPCGVLPAGRRTEGVEKFVRGEPRSPLETLRTAIEVVADCIRADRVELAIDEGPQPLIGGVG